MKAFFFNNLSYKFVALVVAMVLWLSMLGRKDSTLVKDYQLQVLTGSALELTTPVPDFLRVEIMGPRVALKKLGQSPGVYTLDLTGSGAGRKTIILKNDNVNLPLGARVLSITPREFHVNLKAVPPPSAVPEMKAHRKKGHRG